MAGRVFRGWSNWYFGGWMQTNSAKKYWFYSELLYITRSLFNSKRYQASFGHTYRFSSKFSVNHNINLEPQVNNTGFAGFSGDDIIFGRRNISTAENRLYIKYSFNNRMVVTTNIRHYWSKVDYRQYYTLMQNGKLAENTSFTGNVNQNYNAFTVDAVYTWEFAPGSFFNLVWKNNSTTFDRLIKNDYFENFNNTVQSTANNNLSVKVIYFLDYLDIKKWKKKKLIQ